MPAPTKQTKRRFGLLDFIRIFLVLVILCALGGIAYRLWDYKTGTDRYEQLQQQAVQPVEETQEEGFDPLDIDFDALREEGPDIIGWIDFDSVEISYPIVYSGDNSYYLRRLWDGSYNQAGTLFLEGNNQSLDDLHAIVYGHNMRNGTMFAPLKEYLDPDFFAENGGWFTLYTPEGAWRYQLFSIHEAEPDDSLYTAGFVVGDEYTAFLKTLREARLYDTGVTVYSDDHVLTLSTCTDDGNGRIVAHARRAEAVELS